jgi:hypothetical protein
MGAEHAARPGDTEEVFLDSRTPASSLFVHQHDSAPAPHRRAPRRSPWVGPARCWSSFSTPPVPSATLCSPARWSATPTSNGSSPTVGAHYRCSPIGWSSSALCLAAKMTRTRSPPPAQTVVVRHRRHAISAPSARRCRRVRHRAPALRQRLLLDPGPRSRRPAGIDRPSPSACQRHLAGGRSPPATPPGCCVAAARSGAATSAGPQPIRAKPRRRLAGLNLAVLGFDHPGELLQRVDDLVEQIARAGVDGVDGVVHITHGVDRCVRPSGHQIDDIAGA